MSQRIWLGALAASVSLGFALSLHLTLIALIAVSIVFYGGLLLLKAWLVQTAWLEARRRRRDPLAGEPTVADKDLPSYTVLVPLFHEADVVEPLLVHLSRLDYPSHLLEVLFLCEADDDETLTRLRSLPMPPDWRVIVCAPGVPRTKPRACNIGLAEAHGRHVVIYDAEDRPELDQLRKAAAMFASAPQTTTCLQARLDYHNHDRNWLTRFFTLEYNFWFDLLLPALVRHDLPIPLGGTSNHFRTEVLRELGGWDPYNVTEDADLGLRLYVAGYRTEMLPSLTQEEACARVRPWVRQRTRWLKGYLQTWAVGARSNAVWKRGGWRGGLTMHLLVGGTPIVNVINPLFWAANIYYAITRDQRILALFPRPLLYAAVFVFLTGNFLFVYTNFLGLVHRERWHLLSAVLLTPFYWLLMSVAAVRAFGQLVTNPHLWEKTPHGLTGAATDPVLAYAGAHATSTARLTSAQSEAETMASDGRPTVTPDATVINLTTRPRSNLLASFGILDLEIRKDHGPRDTD
jgi:cellulose synthase/poly-beta-1,6-N-acetylglucosamine synthase-like glycosyltransferase